MIVKQMVFHKIASCGNHYSRSLSECEGRMFRSHAGEVSFARAAAAWIDSRLLYPVTPLFTSGWVGTATMDGTRKAASQDGPAGVWTERLNPPALLRAQAGPRWSRKGPADIQPEDRRYRP